MENLAGVRWIKKQSRKQRKDHGRSLHYWPFYQLQQFIEYKATLAGIEVEYVNRDRTSLTCSRCGEAIKGRPKSRWFVCPRCRKTKHIDVNAADNSPRRSVALQHNLAAWCTAFGPDSAAAREGGGHVIP